jgi:hypothetical protein
LPIYHETLSRYDRFKYVGSITIIGGEKMKKLFLVAVLITVLAIPATSMAGTDFFINFGIGLPAPVYVAPSPVYFAPPPVIVAPRPVFIQPAPVFIAPYGHLKYHKHHKKHYKHYYKYYDDDYDD